MLIDNLFLKDDDLSNIQNIGYPASFLFPLFFNKNRTDSVKENGILSHTFQIEKDVNGNPTLGTIYRHEPPSNISLVNKWKFFFK